jgi:hypothetical protein
VAILEGDLLRRAGDLPAVGCALIDRGLDHILAPFVQRTAARALVPLARGSVVRLASARHLRLFCHWMEDTDGPRVDLDLSVALFDEDWSHVGTCDYTHLKSRGAVHSGDLTSAPSPLGASEFVDLDTEVLAAHGARYAMVVIFSYNDVPFTEMAEAFAGFMLRTDAPDRGAAFDARAVEQRFDLATPGKMTVPMIVDLADRTMRWCDVTAGVTGTGHAVHRHGNKLAVLGDALTRHFAAGTRVSLGELACLHAAARADDVLIRDGGRLDLYRRRDGEDRAAFAHRLRRDDPDGAAGSADAGRADLQFVLHGGPAPVGAQIYALHHGDLDARTVDLLAAGDVAERLAAA